MEDVKIWVEFIGYFGSFLVVISMLMTSVKKLRLVNTTGSIIFMIYALIIKSYPTALMNFCLVLINIYQLYQLEKETRRYQIIKVGAREGMTEYLLEHYNEDIRKNFPEAFKTNINTFDQNYIVTCDTTPCGLMMGRETSKGTMDILIDYVTPSYRDLSVGKHLYEHLPEYNIKKLVFSVPPHKHEDYLRQVGYVKKEEGYVKEL
ncbi:MAG: YgjV family protein [Lachnospiraceae bacterium]|nr:YgjV family protein [Lachnospiraceae bacterium]